MTEDLSREEIKANAEAKALEETRYWRKGYEQGYTTGYRDARARYNTCDHRIETYCEECPAPEGGA